MNSERIFSMWTRLGANFPAFEPSEEEPSVEELIARTSVVGRYEPRLIEVMAGWLQKHGDLVNTALMRRHITAGDSAVIGLVFDVLCGREAIRLKQLTKYCLPKQKAEMLFHAAEMSPMMKVRAVENESSLNRKWNLFYVSLRVKTDAVFDRREVLRRNPDLARRALFGVVQRTEILNYLLRNGVSFPAEIAKELGYRYHRVLVDIQGLISDGAVIDTSTGRKRQLEISPDFHRYLTAMPY